MPIGYTLKGTLMILIIPIYLIVIVLLAFLKRKSNKTINIAKEIFKFFCMCDILLIIGLNLFPIDLPSIAKTTIPNNYIPFKYIFFTIRSLPLYIIENFVAFLILGFFLPILCKKFKNTKNFIVLSLLMCMVLEILKLTEYSLNITYGSFDITDVILNTVGIFIGYFIYFLLSKHVIKFANETKLS